MLRPVPLILVLALMLTSIGLGAARGTVLSASRIVICTGHGVVVVTRPDDQGRTASFCPDMALSLLAAIASDAALLPRRTEARLRQAGSRPARRKGGPWSVIRVRDPPAAPSANDRQTCIRG